MITSIDKLLAQQIVNTVKDVCGYNINFINQSGIIFASTDERRIGSFHEIGMKAAQTEKMIEVDVDNSFEGTQKGVNLPVYHKDVFLAVVGISGEPEEVRKYAYLAERITHLLIRERELNAFSRTLLEKRHYVIQSLINREFLNMGYLLECLKDLKIDREGEKRMMIIRISQKCHLVNDSIIEKKLQKIFEVVNIRLFTHNYPNEYLAVIDDRDFQMNIQTIRKFAEENEPLLEASFGKSCPVLQLADSYESGITALKSLTELSGNLVIFDDLTLEIVLSSMDRGSREEFLHKTLAKLSEEDITLISVYFEEEMSLKNTCQRLYLHKNTIQQRLNKISVKCGLNPRKFRDAAVLYLAVKLKKDDVDVHI